MSRKEIGAFVYRFKHGHLQLLLINNRKQTRWILPKGQIEKHLSDKEVALEEVYEEAGILTRVDNNIPVQMVKYRSSSGPVILFVYAMQVERRLKKWPEQYFRQRFFVDVELALLMVRKKALRQLIKQLVITVNLSNNCRGN